MGLSGISLWQLLIILAIVLLIFGSKKLSSFGEDLGKSVKGFRKAMGDSDKNAEAEEAKRIQEPDADFAENRTEQREAERK